MKKLKIEPKFIIIDLFCGFGGTTTGFHQTGGIAKVIACVNHDPKAIKSHWLNYPGVKHFEEDIRTLELGPLVKHLNKFRKLYPNAKVILWASLECTNFSKAKGGLPRDADSRTLADHLHRYILALNPDYIKIENVVEFMSWGPLDKNGKPESRRNGSDWLRWCKEVCDHGYYDQWQEMNSANYGAYTSRNRLFGCFAKKGLSIAWPTPTHAKRVHTGDMFANILKPWKPVREVLHLDQEGISIFSRKKDLSPKTLERIYAGLVKFVAGGEKVFIAKYYSGRPAGKVTSVEVPAGVLSTVGNQGLVTANFILKYNSTNKSGKVSSGHSIEEPSPVVSTQGRLGIVNAQFLDVIYGNGYPSGVDNVSPTLRTKDGLALVSMNQFVNIQMGKSIGQDIDSPIGSIPTVPKVNLVTAKPFIVNQNFSNGPGSIDEPIGVITANRKYHYIVNPSYYGHTHDIDSPCPVIVARQDKAPLYIVDVTTGDLVGIQVDESDSEILIKIKEFMVLYGIIDIKMRMLMVPELLKIQGFPANYKMVGNQTDAKKFIGNSVVPHVVKAWALRMAEIVQPKLSEVA